MTPDLAGALAAAFLSGQWSSTGLLTSGARVVRRPAWLPVLVGEVLEVYRTAPLDRPRELAQVVASRPAAGRARAPRIRTRPAAPTAMVTNPWHLPRLDDLEDLARLLAVEPRQLAWYADVKGLARTTGDEALQHYRSSWRPAPSGAVRVLEAPKPRLKALQRRLLHEVLAGVPAHDAAHGFRPGRSVATYAAPHARRKVVLRLDLEGFFAAVSAGRVFGVLRTAGYPEPVAHGLTGLVTTVLPRWAWAGVPRPADPDLLPAHWRLGRRLAAPHLPQGAPTSPALANLAAHRLDARLSGLVQAWDGSYTRYADDLALSGDWGGDGSTRLLALVAQVVVEEGFRLNPRKTAVLRHGGRQVLGGLVVNQSPHVGRREVDRLRAVLHNCVRTGPGEQNRDGHPDFRAHLRGRVAWVAQHDPARGERLRVELDRIDWGEPQR